MASGDCTPELLALEEKNDSGLGDGSHIPHLSLVHPFKHAEPIVTRRELWSYFCKRLSVSSHYSNGLLVHVQCILTAVRYVTCFHLQGSH
jgi:hypothetical protein